MSVIPILLFSRLLAIENSSFSIMVESIYDLYQYQNLFLELKKKYDILLVSGLFLT